MAEADDNLKALDESTIITILDRDGKIIHVNDKFCEVSGYTEEELLGKAPTDLLKSGFHGPEFYKEIGETLGAGKVWKGDVKNKSKDGRFFWTRTVIVPFLDQTGKIDKTIAIRTDITERVEAQERLKKAFDKISESERIIKKQMEELKEMEKLKDQFASMITHELKTPLVPIKGYSEMLVQPGILGDMNKEQLDAVNEIMSSAKRLEMLIRDVLDAQKLDMKKMLFNKQDFDVTKLMAQIAKDLTSIMKDKSITLADNSQKEELIINSDSARLRQVVENLMRNSVDFVPEGKGRIEIACKGEDAKVVVYVKDNGVGIPKEKQKSLFKKFFQADASATRKHGGTGLGLAICKGIVEGLGGEIWFESEPGQGTTFFFSIPNGKAEKS